MPSPSSAPLRLRSLNRVDWRRCGRRVWLDSAADELAAHQVYRYASLAEALRWLSAGTTGFARPSVWSDRYERHVAERLWGDGSPLGKVDAFLKCLSFEYGSEALWRTYAGQGGVLRIGIRLRDLIAELNRAHLPDGARVMVGRCRYLDERDLQRALDRLQEALPTAEDPRDVAMRALLLKRSGFAWENELRIAVLVPAGRIEGAILGVSDLRPGKLQGVQIDPYLPGWQAQEWQRVLGEACRSVRVVQSNFDAEPVVRRHQS